MCIYIFWVVAKSGFSGVTVVFWTHNNTSFFFFFLISNICIDKKGNLSTLEVNKGKEITNKNYKSLGNQ